MRRSLLLGLLLIASLGIAGCQKAREALRGFATARSTRVEELPSEASGWSAAERGAFLAQHGDLGVLSTDGLQQSAAPWKLLMVLPDVVPEPFFGNPQRGWLPLKEEPLARFGLLYGARMVGPPGMPRLDPTPIHEPLGYVHGVARRKLPQVALEIGSGGCTVCHAGRTWDEQGRPSRDAVWWGVPNHAFDGDGLVRALIASMNDPRASDGALLAAMARRFPKMELAEVATFQRYVLPGLRKALKESGARWGGVHPWRFGGPGFSHGTAILTELLAPDVEALKASDFRHGYVKVPNVDGAPVKPALLIDGSYAGRSATQEERFLDHLVAFLPVLGASPAEAIKRRDELRDVAAFLRSYAPPKFPGPIDATRAARGSKTFAMQCAACHGDRDEKSGRYAPAFEAVKVAELGTDPERSLAVTPELVKRFAKTEVGAVLEPKATGRYLAPSLHGVWAQAPYLHNGSVPTLWHLLRPKERPARFWSGSFALDLKRVGIAGQLDADGTWTFPADYLPTSEPQLFDTTQPGRSNRGHETQVESLTDDEALDLLEYLKGL